MNSVGTADGKNSKWIVVGFYEEPRNIRTVNCIINIFIRPTARVTCVCCETRTEFPAWFSSAPLTQLTRALVSRRWRHLLVRSGTFTTYKYNQMFNPVGRRKCIFSSVNFGFKRYLTEHFITTYLYLPFYYTFLPLRFDIIRKKS